MQKRLSRTYVSNDAKTEREGIVLILEGLPPIDVDVKVYCIDKKGVYALPYRCFFDGEVWVNSRTNDDIVGNVFGWRCQSQSRI